MNAPITPVRKIATLIRREFWEQRFMFLLFPIASVLMAAVMNTVVIIRALIKDQIPWASMMGRGARSDVPASLSMQEFDLLSNIHFKEAFWNQYYEGSALLLFMAFWGIIAYYYLMTLYQQRKDRSILFWNSMPVSDSHTIVSKLLAGMVCAQGVFLGCLLLMHLVFLLIFSIYASFFDVSVWDSFIAPAQIFPRVAWYTLFALLNIFWCLPGYGWLLLVSARARSAPFAWVVAPLVILIIPEFFFTSRSRILTIVADHLFPQWVIIQNNSDGFTGRLEHVLNMEMLASVILGIVFIYAAIRFNRSEDI